MFRRNLPPALLAEWPGSLTCHCGNMGVEWTPNKKSAHKVDSGEENSPAAPAGIQTHLSIVSLALEPTSYLSSRRNRHLVRKRKKQRQTLLGFFKAVILRQPLGVRHVNLLLVLWMFLHQREGLVNHQAHTHTHTQSYSEVSQTSIFSLSLHSGQLIVTTHIHSHREVSQTSSSHCLFTVDILQSSHTYTHSHSEVSQTSSSHCLFTPDILRSSHTYTQSKWSLPNFIFSLSAHSGQPMIIIHIYTVIEKSNKLHLLIVCSFWTSYDHHTHIHSHREVSQTSSSHCLFILDILQSSQCTHSLTNFIFSLSLPSGLLTNRILQPVILFFCVFLTVKEKKKSK